MIPDLTEPGPDLEYEALAVFTGEPGIFWARLAGFARTRLGAAAACLLLDGGPAGGDLRVLAQAPAGASRRLAQSGMAEELRAVESAHLVSLESVKRGQFEALLMPVQEGAPRSWLTVEFGPEPPAQDGARDEARKTVPVRVRSLAEIYQARRREQRMHQKLLTLSEALDLGLALGESSHFDEAALRLCNHVAAQMGSPRVSLAWAEGADLELCATSHGGRISKSSQEALALVQVLEESMDQNNEVAFPAIGGSQVVNREHRQFSLAHEGVSILSVPLRDHQQVVGVLGVERAAGDGSWAVAELDRLRLLADLAAPRLEGLHLGTGWVGKRAWRVVRRRAAGLLGPENTGWKLVAVLAAVTLPVMAVVHVEHKVRAPFILKTDAAALISAPFPGYIREAGCHLGDIVKKGQMLVTLDQRELLLEEADTVAARNRSEREARSYEAEGKLSQMLVAQAEKEQSEARLAIIRRRIELTRVEAPFDGVVVEGDLRERLSSPVQTGEPLLKLVQLRDLYGQLQVDERDVPYLEAGREGELAFASRPGEKFPVRVDRFEPVAEVRPEGTVFMLRAQILGGPESWWRPGMSGVCKIHAGDRSLLWIAGHRLVETLRLWFWV